MRAVIQPRFDKCLPKKVFDGLNESILQVQWNVLNR